MMKKESKSNKFWGGKRYLPKYIHLNKLSKVYGIFGISIIFFAFLLVCPMFSALTLTDGKTSQLAGIFRLKPDDTFAIHYIHSIHKTPVIEKYYIDEDYNIVIDELIYESYGVGMPSSIEKGQTFRQEGGAYIIGNINRALPFFDQSVGQVAANHQLLIHEKTIPLSTFTAPGNWLRIQMKRVSLIRLWKEGA